MVTFKMMSFPENSKDMGFYLSKLVVMIFVNCYSLAQIAKNVL